MKEKFNPEERRIIGTLYSAHKPLTTLAVAEHAEMSWPTAKKYLTRLNCNGYVSRKKSGKSMYWWLRVC
ncbi:MAG: MarR family winged helix-turn-helix transcriptional regulator [Methanoregula sp.]|jgi:DNA-binding MarR family transcriptional regulator|nr:MarR family winged helix-turn-helix transcriptional regulator [Methanoregula sp.]